VASGLRRFYFPTTSEQTGIVYEWSFLKPLSNWTFPSGHKRAPAERLQLGQRHYHLKAIGTATQPYKIEWSNIGKIKENVQRLSELDWPAHVRFD